MAAGERLGPTPDSVPEGRVLPQSKLKRIADSLTTRADDIGDIYRPIVYNPLGYLDTRAPYYVAVAAAERQFDPEALEELMSSIKAPLEHAGLLNDQLFPTQARFLDANRMALPSFKVFEIVGRRITRLDVEDLDIPYFNPQKDGEKEILSRYITVTLYPSIESARAAVNTHIKSPGGLENPSYLTREEIQRFRVTRTA